MVGMRTDTTRSGSVTVPMDRHERRVACLLLREHFGPTAVGECSETPYIVVSFSTGQILAKVGDEVDWSDGRAIADNIINWRASK